MWSHQTGLEFFMEPKPRGCISTFQTGWLSCEENHYICKRSNHLPHSRQEQRKNGLPSAEALFMHHWQGPSLLPPVCWCLIFVDNWFCIDAKHMNTLNKGEAGAWELEKYCMFVMGFPNHIDNYRSQTTKRIIWR